MGGSPRLFGGRFEPQTLAGRGGMGEVWRALDRETGATVALKRLRTDDGHAMARFEREARLLAAVDHPAIVRHLGHGVDAGERWIAMEWLEGRDLASHLRVERMGVAEICRLGVRVAEALACLHARGVIHR